MDSFPVVNNTGSFNNLVPDQPGPNFREFRDMVTNILSMRLEAFQRSLDPRRDIDDECGFPNTAKVLSAYDYRDLVFRNSTANRVVEVVPIETWQTQPEITEDEDSSVVTQFEQAWEEMCKGLRGGSKSHFKGKTGNPVWEYLLRADRLSGRSSYGIILLGLDDRDDGDLSRPAGETDLVTGLPHEVAYSLRMSSSGVTMPLTPPNYQSINLGGIDIPSPRPITTNTFLVNGPPPSAYQAKQDANPTAGKPGTPTPPTKPTGPTPPSGPGGSLPPGKQPPQPGQDPNDPQTHGTPEEPPEPWVPRMALMFLRVFPEDMAHIVEVESDHTSPRFGLPVSYNVTFNDPRETTTSSLVGMNTVTKRVHWSRVIHVADNLDSSEVFGVPRCKPIVRHLLSLEKLYGGSAEMYWRGAFPGLSFETHPQLGGQVIINKEKMRNEIEQYMNGLQRYLIGSGMAVNQLAPQVADPTPQIAVQLEAICIKLGMPVRVFKGSERGELASSQDDAAWNDRLRARRDNYVTPKLIVPFVDRLIQLGVLPEPEDGYGVKWANLDSLTDTEKANIANVRMTTVATYIQGQCSTIIPETELLTRFLNMTEEEAQMMYEQAQQATQLKQQQDLEMQQRQIEMGLVSDPTDTDQLEAQTPEFGAKHQHQGPYQEQGGEGGGFPPGKGKGPPQKGENGKGGGKKGNPVPKSLTR